MKVLRNLGIFFIVTGAFLQLVKSGCEYYSKFQRDYYLKQNTIETLKLASTSIHQKMNDYKTESVQLNSLYQEYFETIHKKNKEYEKIMDTISNNQKEIQNLMDEIDRLCKNDFTEESVQKACDQLNENYQSFKTSYETTIDNYNYIIEKYNEWAKTKKYASLKFYEK